MLADPSLVLEPSRAGSYFLSAFYTRVQGGALYRQDVVTGAIEDLVVVPAVPETATDVDLSTGEIYLAPDRMIAGTFQVYSVPKRALKTLAPVPAGVGTNVVILHVR